MQVPLLTSYFRAPGLAREPLVKVRIARGAPAFPLPYPDVPLEALMPPGWVLGRLRGDRDAYEAAYRDHLNRIGVERLREEFAALRAAHGGQPLVLLCYESLRRPDEWCHRRMFAAWWEEQTGERVPEFRAPGQAEQLTLF